MKDIRQKLLATFQVEHRDHVEQIRSLLAMIEKTAQPSAGAELEEAFRRAHSLKGAARAVDLRAVEGLAHRLETLFSRVRQGALPLDRATTSVVGQVLDASEDCVASLGQDRPASSFGPALQAIEKLLGLEAELAAAAGPEPLPTQFRQIETMRITAQNFDGLLHSAGALLAENQRQNLVAAQLAEAARQLAVMKIEVDRARQAVRSTPGGLEPRRELARVTRPLDSIESQRQALARRLRAARHLHQRTCWNARQIGKQLQRDVWQARMISAESLFEGYRKMVRDLARDESKEIDFRTSSAGVQADRRVLETLKDPLMHLLRNAVSHGIEPPEERTRKGKPSVGVVTFSVAAHGQRLDIAVCDDGRGIDLTGVVKVAIRQGLLTEAEAARRSPHELARLLFRPGFSTASSVTPLAGRGMGLSVVQEAVRRLQGDVDVQPSESGGMCVHIAVPLTISTHRLLLARCAGQSFAVPLHAVERLYRIARSNVESSEGKPVVRLDGQQLPLFSLRALLKLEAPPGAASAPGGEAEWLPIMILRSGGRRTAVAVDSFLSEADAVVQNLGPGEAMDGKLSSAIVLEDGAVAFVLNPIELVDASAHSQASFLLPPAAAAHPREPASILVVDDSMTTRLLEKSILEAHGYRVRVAVDGLEALDRLRAEKSDLVIADIQMPRLDGFGLLEAMKKESDLQSVPVIIVTSLERREDQERGLALGADAYVVKRKFDQDELLAAIRQIL